MLLLIRSFASWSSVQSYIYIPLCFYLYCYKSGGECKWTYLHSTMLLLIRWPPFWECRLLFIYIPLCFYLYSYRKCFRWQAFVFTFHYASTYTKFGSAEKMKSANLHSTMLLLILCRIRKWSTENIIYIPLCFYLYAGKYFFVRFYTKFTFHYASTYTIGKIIWFPRRDQFTFHYASTYTQKHHVHRDCYLIYIPLCFYLYRPLHSPARSRRQFTFHYASTYTTFYTWFP